MRIRNKRGCRLRITWSGAGFFLRSNWLGTRSPQEGTPCRRRRTLKTLNPKRKKYQKVQISTENAEIRCDLDDDEEMSDSTSAAIGQLLQQTRAFQEQQRQREIAERAMEMQHRKEQSGRVREIAPHADSDDHRISDRR